MLIALISTLGSGLLGTIAVLMHYLLKQNAQRAEEHKVAMAAIARLTERVAEMHQEAMNAIAKVTADLTAHTEALHREAMVAIARHGERIAALEAAAGLRAAASA